MDQTTTRPSGRTIAVVNRKGGVGKSATTANLGAALARRGRLVLIVDSDSQRNLTTHVGTPERRDDPDAYTINEAYRSVKHTGAAIAPSVCENVDLLYGSSFLEDTEKEILTMQHATAGLIMQKMVRRALEGKPYDYVLIDCPPSEGLLTRNAIVAADSILAPVSADYAGFEGIGRLRELLDKLDAQEAFDRGVPHIATVATFVEEGALTSRTLRDYMLSPEFNTENASETVRVTALRTVIHRSQHIKDSYGENVSVFGYTPVDGTGRKRDTEKGLLRARAEYDALAAEIDNG